MPIDAVGAVDYDTVDYDTVVDGCMGRTHAVALFVRLLPWSAR
jgi:hypothetical protein